METKLFKQSLIPKKKCTFNSTIQPGTETNNHTSRHLMDVYSTSLCIDMRTIASCTWLMKPEAMVMAIAEINLDLKKFANGVPAMDLG